MTSSSPTIAPGSVVIVRDEEWLVTSMETTDDATLLSVQGLSELVRGTSATFYDNIDHVEVSDPRDAQLVGDDSPGYRRARLWLEATARKTPVPLSDPTLTVSAEALATPLAYQRAAVTKALDPDNLRPRILLADAVGLGKTLEIGMILAELTRRGRGERILIVCPRHVLEQMQRELWTRFALPFVRLDSVGVQRVKQVLPATRNPFTYFKRVIISIDTLKQGRFASDLRRHRWDAVVIDESHNVTNSQTENNRLARVLAPNTDALILASATPHNGQKESFAELVRLLEPTAVDPTGELIHDEVARLVVRRHRHSPEVADVVGADWAERCEPQHFVVTPSPAEDAVARELDAVWLHPAGGRAPSVGDGAGLFPWTLAKAFLSSPAALAQTVNDRRAKAVGEEAVALDRLQELNEACLTSRGGKYGRLLDYLREIGVGSSSPTRGVVFAERVATLGWLAERLRHDLRLPDDAVAVLYGGLDDTTQQEVVESFKQGSSPTRLLVTGDVASEGVNLHAQCHELIHYDIPWSLIRIEQRNGRIDRYGQRHSPQITTLLLNPSTEGFAGDIRVLARLLEKEAQAHAALGDAASLMGRYSVRAEESEILSVLAGRQSLDDVVRDVDTATLDDPVAALLAELAAVQPAQYSPASGQQPAPAASLYARPVDFLRDALVEVFTTPDAEPFAGGVRWREHADHGLVSLIPPVDLKQRLRVLPRVYLRERRIDEDLMLATTQLRGRAALSEALNDPRGHGWPEASYLGPLHPVLEWAADRALATLSRRQLFVVRGDVAHPTVLLLGTLTNRRGQVVAAGYLAVEFPNPAVTTFAPTTAYASVAELAETVGFRAGQHNPGAVADPERFAPLLVAAVGAGEQQLEQLFHEADSAARARLTAWQQRAGAWAQEADALVQRSSLRQHRGSVAEEERLVAELTPDRRLVRPLLVVVPEDEQ
ncbi:SNF2-related protein [uncultured Friedmanniella sp.]|uniref:SNF2-related protein n=1 Tax=uncultured Friedmanniella sp. TaxID=335381 RepID=UPI0035CC4825